MLMSRYATGNTVRLAALCVLSCTWPITPAPASAQIMPSDGATIRYGHHHLNVGSVDAQKAFWSTTLGGVPVKVGPIEGVKLPGGLILFRPQAPTAGTKGSTVNHVGVQVPDLRATLGRLRTAGYPIVTKQEVASIKPEDVKDDIAYIPNQDATIAFVMGPDEIKLELFENKAMREPIALHHIHFASSKVKAMTDWYARVLSATRDTRGTYETVELPGMSLRWTAVTEPPSGTKGRALDHIGFEVSGLEELCRRLEQMGVTFDQKYAKDAALNLGKAYLYDSDGTYIELTEGLGRF